MKMKTSLFILLAMVSFNIYGQDTTYYDSSANKVNRLADASYYEIVTKSKSDTNRITEKVYYKSGQLKSRHHSYLNSLNRIPHGKQLEFYPDGKQKSEIDYFEGKNNGILKTWFENGQLRRKDSFYMDEFIVGNCYTANGNDTNYFEYMTQPSYPKGENYRQQFLSDHIIYPDSARENDIQGIVYISFVVEPDGSITNVTAINGNKTLSKEAVRVVKLMPNWDPGLLEGKKVRVKINMPISFLLEDNSN